jgi:phage baseplate assembly protein W
MSLPQGNTAREEVVSSNRRSQVSINSKVPIGIKTPLEPGRLASESLFKMHFDIRDQILDNLKNLLMTKKGERIGFGDYGTDLWAVYNSELSKDEIYDYAMKEIKDAVNKYIPNISLTNFYSDKLSSFTPEQKLGNEKEFEKNSKAFDFYDAQGATQVTKGKIEVNSNDPNVDQIYKLTVEYKIPKLDDKSYTAIVFLRTSK